MAWKNLVLCYILICTCFYVSVKSEFYTQPEQIHLSYTGIPSEMMVTWVTINDTNSSIVEYGENSLSNMAKGKADKFVDGGPEKRVIYNHRVKLSGLKPGQQYEYHVGSQWGWSAKYTFKAIKSGNDWSPTVLLFGDMGNDNPQSLSRLQEETQRGHYDAILHVGDIAYNMDDDNGRVGDAFMNQIETVAAYIPYMTCVGNHEQMYNFSNYKKRFTMPGGDGEGMFYSFDMGPVHFVMFSSEFYYYLNYGWAPLVTQYNWLEEDLAEANKNRDVTPWIISFCHRPLYCSNSNDPEHCHNKENLIRVGIPFVHSFGVEDLLYKYGVDLHFQAHEHSYERFWPVYNRTVCNGSSDNPYHNPRAPVHILTGSAGSKEGVDPFIKKPHPWSAHHSDDYGYTRMNIINSTHLYLEQVSDDQKGAVIDKMLLVQEHHGAGRFDCHMTKGQSASANSVY